ncbi:MAG: hypothetical protein ACTHWF_05905 [Brachybacterium sp.]
MTQRHHLAAGKRKLVLEGLRPVREAQSRRFGTLFTAFPCTAA